MLFWKWGFVFLYPLYYIYKHHAIIFAVICVVKLPAPKIDKGLHQHLLQLLYILHLLQINKKRMRDDNCSSTKAWISEAGNVLDIVVCRNPLTEQNTVHKDARTRKPLPAEPPSECATSPSSNQSNESFPVYMNIYNLDTPVARSEKACKTV